PGYPLYTVLSHLATWIPIGNIASRVHGFTAFLGALTCVGLFHIIRRLNVENSIAFIASLCFGFSLTFWSQAIIAEVYTLNALIVLLLIYLSLEYLDSQADSKKQKILNWLVLVYGLGLSNHWPLVVASSPAILILLWPGRRKLLLQLPKAMLCIIPGLLFYAWMVYRSQMAPLISFYGPINSLQEFWFYVSREGYAAVDDSVTAGWYDKLNFISFFFRETFTQFGPTGIVPMVAGFFYQWACLNKYIIASLLILFAGNSILLILLLGFDFDFLHQNIFRVYPLISYACSAIWLALGIKAICIWVNKVSHQEVIQRNAVIMLGLLMVGTTFMANAADNFRRNDQWVEEFTGVILDQLLPDSILFTYGDTDIWTLGYMHHVLNQRPDIEIYSLKGTVYSNRLFKQYETPYETAESIIRDFVKNADRPVYYVSSFISGFGETDYGLVKHIEKQRPPQYTRVVMLPEFRQYIETQIIRGEPVNNWEKMHYRQVLSEFCGMSIDIMRFSESNNYNSDQVEWVNKVCNTFHGNLRYAEALLSEENIDINKVESVLSRAEEQMEGAILKSELGMYYFLQGELKSQSGD
ncbi:MAG: DUF2723 domain-containing protein, partial [Gammaproteobacteria bacterium]|nr:DUF2723 domain-containing protein [Gammaproteobacteria bacterium]